jgi:outer membrane lipoprotein-sorting protein
VALPARREPVTEEARAALALLIERWHEFSDLRALADVVVTRSGRRQQITGVLLARAPSSVRLEALSPFGAPLWLLTVHRGQMIAYDAVANEATIGPADAETAARVLSLALDPDDVVDEHGRSLDLIGRLHRQRVWMDFTTGVVTRLEIVGGRYVARIVFHRDGETLTGLDVDAAEGVVTATIRYRNVTMGAGIEDERFEFAVPKGAKTQPIR